jgi:uncharacterized protein (DUF1499 family)
MKTFFIVILILFAAGLLLIRFAPIDRDRWHVDPADAENPERSGVRFIGREAPRFPGDPDTVLTVFDEIAMSEPRTRLLEGDIDEGMLTYVSRSRVFGFADFITVKAVSEGEQTKLSVISRARVGSRGYDWGVNAERLDLWLQDMRLRLGE